MVNPDFYSQTHKFTCQLCKRPIHVITKPGFAHWNQITPATVLLAEAADLAYKSGAPPKEILALGSGHGALCVALAQLPHVEAVWVADTTLTALQMSERTLQANAISKAHILYDALALDTLTEHFDQIYMELPKGRQFTRRWLVETWNALKPGGYLYLAGANKEGIQSAIQDARDLYGNATILAYKKGNRVARMVKKDALSCLPLWARLPGIKPGTWIEFEILVRGIALKIRSLPGVFSAHRLDEGTKLLLEHIDLPTGAYVLDAGCGYGVIGLFAWMLGATCIDMIDNHLLSVTCAQENIRQNLAAAGTTLPARLQAFSADALHFHGDHEYTLIISNPPFHAGKSVDTAAASTFIAQAWRLLKPGGKLILVANRFLRYDRLMEALFGNISRLYETGKYHILASTK